MNINIKKRKKRKIRFAASKDFFVKEKINSIDFRDLDILKKFINPQGRINPQSYNRLLRKHQKKISLSIRRARQMALLPYEIQLQNIEQQS